MAWAAVWSLCGLLQRLFRVVPESPHAGSGVQGSHGEIQAAATLFGGGMSDQLIFFDAYSRSDAVEASVMLRPFRNRRKRMRVDADHPPPAHNPVNAWNRSVQVPRSIVQVQADSASKGVKIDMLNPSAASSALKPRSPLLVPRYQNGISVDQNIRCASGELVV